jgi:hypothetical protein
VIGLSPSSLVSPANIIPPLLYTHLSPTNEAYGSSDEAAHYHTLGPKLRASCLTQHLDGTEERSILFVLEIYVIFFLTSTETQYYE